MSDICSKFKKPKHIDSSHSAYEWWLKAQSGLTTPKAKVGSEGLDISIFNEREKLRRFKKMIAANSKLSRYFDGKVLYFVNRFRRDLNVEGRASLITPNEVKALARGIDSEQYAYSKDVIVDIIAAGFLLNNLENIRSDSLKHAVTMREAYLASQISAGKGVVPPQSLPERGYQKSAVDCLITLIKANPKLKRNWRLASRGKLNGVTLRSYSALFKAMVPEPKKVRSKIVERKVEAIKKKVADQLPKVQKKKSGRTIKIIIGVALTLILIFL